MPRRLKPLASRRRRLTSKGQIAANDAAIAAAQVELTTLQQAAAQAASDLSAKKGEIDAAQIQLATLTTQAEEAAAAVDKAAQDVSDAEVELTAFWRLQGLPPRTPCKRSRRRWPPHGRHWGAFRTLLTTRTLPWPQRRRRSAPRRGSWQLSQPPQLLPPLPSPTRTPQSRPPRGNFRGCVRLPQRLTRPYRPTPRRLPLPKLLSPSLQGQITAANTEIASKQGQLTLAQTQLATLNTTKNALEAEIAALTAQINEINGNSRAKRDLQDLRAIKEGQLATVTDPDRG